MKLFLFVVIVFAVIGAALIGTSSDPERQQLITRASTPEDLAQAILHGRGVKTMISGPVLNVEYDLKAILTAGTAISGFNMDTRSLVPEVFEKFPAVATIRIVALGPFRDLKGNDSSGPMFRITFTRANAATVRWDKISYGNIPKIADSYWAHPSLLKD